MTNTIGTASIELAVDASGVESGINRAEAAIGRGTKSIQNLGTQGAAAFGGLGSDSAQAATRVDASTRSLVNSVQRTTAAMEAGSRGSRQYFEVLANQRGANLDVLRPYLDQLQSVADRQKHVGVSAGQTAAALRQVPAQVTDIVTALQGGQQPLTVFLQQGGQLRDMFGSSGAAARALGGYVVGLINPYTVAAAAVGALALAYYQGSQEADGYARALINTGNAAGATSGQLADIARKTGDVVGTQHEAAEAITALAATGQVKYRNLQAFTLATVEAQRSLGKAVSETAEEFEGLGRSPLESIERLNQKYNFLTAAVYEQVKALQDQGRTEEAGEVAQKAYAEALESRSKAVQANLGVIEKSWKGVVDAAKGAWDSMLDVGRKDTVEQQLANIDRQIKAAQRNLYSYIEGPQAKKRIEELRKEQEILQATIREQNRANEAKDASNKKEKARIDWLKEGEQYQARQEKLEEAITRARNVGAAAGKSQVEIETRVGEIRKRYADIYVGGIDAQIEAIKRRASLEDEVAARSRLLLEGDHARGKVNQEDYLRAAEALDQAAFQKTRDRMKEELALTAQKQNSQKEQVALRGQIALVTEQATSRQIQLESDLAMLEDQRARKAAENFANVVDGQLATRDSLRDQLTAQLDSNKEIGLSARALADLTAARLEDQAVIAEGNADLADSIDLTGQMSEVYREQASLLRNLAEAKRDGAVRQEGVDAAKEVEQAWKRSSDQIESSLTDALMRGFERGEDGAKVLRDTVVNMFKTMVLRPAVQGLFTGGAASTSGGNASYFRNGQGLFEGFANGLASTGGTLFANLGDTFGSQAVSAFGAGMRMTSGQAAIASRAYTKAGEATVAKGVTAGAGAASALSYVSWIGAGMALANSLFKQGWDPNNGSIQKSTNLAPIAHDSLVLNKAFSAIGMNNSMANLFSGASLVSRIWGRKAPEIESQGIEGTLSSKGFDGAAYANILQKGGFLRSDKRYVQTSALGAEQDSVLDAGMAALLASVREYGKALGLETTAIDGYNKQIKLQLGSDEAANQAAIEKLFAGVGNELASTLLPNIAEFGLQGEAAGATLGRVAAEFSVTNALLGAWGLSAVEVFGAAGLASEKARMQLIDLSGGAEALASRSQYFMQNFLTEAERLVPVQKQVTAELVRLGYANVTTSEQFKRAVLDLTSSGALATESGAQTYAALMALAPAFKEVTDAALASSTKVSQRRAELESQIFDMTHSAEEVTARKRQEELAAMDASLRPLQERIYAIEDEQAAAQASAKATEEAAKASQAAAAAIAKAQEQSRSFTQSFGNALVDTMNRATEAAKALRSYNAELAVGSSSPLSGKDKVAIARQQFDAADSANLPQASSTYLNTLQEAGVGGLDYAKAFAAVQAKVASAAAAQDAYAARIPAFWRSVQEMMRPAGSHASGLDSVPYDGYRAVLHSKEKVLTSAEADDYRGISKELAKQNALLERLTVAMDSGNKDLSLMATIFRGIAPDGRFMRTTSV